MKVDPAGPWMSQAATDYMDERNIEYINKTLQGHPHQKLMEEFPNRSIDELAARAVSTGNNKDMVDGYSPAQ